MGYTFPYELPLGPDVIEFWRTAPRLTDMAIYRIDDITLDTARCRISRGEAEIQVGKLTFELLVLLVESAPATVTREQAADRLWKNRIATPETIRQRVKLLRKALGDNSDNPRYIGVIHGQGYRLIPDVVAQAAASVAPKTSRTWFAAASIAVAILVTFSLYIGSAYDSRPIPADRSIAVLPFESLSPAGADDDDFVDGVHNDLLTELAKLGDLRVISRTSVLEYRGTVRNLRDIAGELDVATILEGSVQRAGDAVRINAQLIDAATDEHLWAETYDRTLTAENLFAIQRDMATSIAGALQAVLSVDELERLSEPPTRNTRAHNFYLIGNSAIRNSNNLVSFRQAAEAYRQAVDEDPEFALAWAMLSRAHSALYFFVEHSDAHLQRAREALEQAFAIEPDLAEAYFAQGYYYYHGFRDDEAALVAWAKAEQGMPGSAALFRARAYLARRMGNWETAIENLERAVELDPRNLEQLSVQWFTYAQLRDYERAERIIDRMIAIAPDQPRTYGSKAFLSLRRDGDSASMRAVLDAAPMLIRAPSMRWRAALYERDYAAALAQLDNWTAEAIDTQLTYQPRAWFYAITHALVGERELAARQFEAARLKIEAELVDRPDDPRLLIALAGVLAHEGHGQRASALAAKAARHFSITMDAVAAPNVHLNAIMALIAAGELDAAISELDSYLSAPAVWSIEGLSPDPRLDPLRSYPAFAALIRKYGRAG